jgi:hypothetical protein
MGELLLRFFSLIFVALLKRLFQLLQLWQFVLMLLLLLLLLLLTDIAAGICCWMTNAIEHLLRDCRQRADCRCLRMASSATAITIDGSKRGAQLDEAAAAAAADDDDKEAIDTKFQMQSTTEETCRLGVKQSSRSAPPALYF